MSPTVLVTGATGFVTANLVRHLAERGHDGVGTDIKPPDPPLRRFLGSLPGSVNFRQIDVTDRAAVAILVQDVQPSRVVHGAAITSIRPRSSTRGSSRPSTSTLRYWRRSPRRGPVVSSSQAAACTVGWQPRYHLDSGLAEYIEWLQQYA